MSDEKAGLKLENEILSIFRAQFNTVNE